MQVLGIDIGTYATKSFLFQNGNASGIDVLDSVVWEITRAKQQEQIAQSGLEPLQPGYYTKIEIGERSPHAQEEWFQFDAMAQDSPILETGIRNIIQQLDAKTGIKLTGELNKWTLMLALAPKETQAARDHLQNVYQNIALKFGFKGLFTLDQMTFDILGTYPTWSAMKKETGSALTKTLVLVNPGGGDTKIQLVADKPLASGLVTKPIGGQKIIQYGRKCLEDLSSANVSDLTELKTWINSWGSVLGHFPNEWNETTEKRVLYNRVEYPINYLLRAPEMFFEPENPLYKLKEDLAIHRMIEESIENVKKKQSIKEYLQEWLGCIILTGGASQFYGMAERLKSELKKIYPEYIINVKVANNPQLTCVNGMIAFLSGLWDKKQKIEDSRHYVSLEKEGSEK